MYRWATVHPFHVTSSCLGELAVSTVNAPSASAGASLVIDISPPFTVRNRFSARGPDPLSSDTHSHRPSMSSASDFCLSAFGTGAASKTGAESVATSRASERMPASRLLVFLLFLHPL